MDGWMDGSGLALKEPRIWILPDLCSISYTYTPVATAPCALSSPRLACSRPIVNITVNVWSVSHAFAPRPVLQMSRAVVRDPRR